MKKKLFLLAPLIPLILSACGTSAPESPASANGKVVAESPVGTKGQLIPISSSNVLAAGFDADSLVMTVKFASGGLYEYYNVPVGLWEEFVAAQPHPWSQVGYPRLVQGGYAYKRIG